MCIESVFEQFLVTFIFDIKIDIIMCEPHYVNLFFLWTSSIVCVFDFLTIWHLFDILTSYWHFEHLFDILTSFNLNHLSPSSLIGYLGTLPIGLLLSNLDSRQLETSPMTSYDQFWNMSTFGDSRAVWVICQKKMPSENWFFLDEGATRLWRGLGVLGGQVPRL